MRTAKKLSPQTSKVYCCELECCPVCHAPLSTCPYRSGRKIVQTRSGRIVYPPKTCLNPHCEACGQMLRSAEWLQIAPMGCTYGDDVIATIGWQRQEFSLTFAELHEKMSRDVAISASQVRYVYTHQDVPLLACHERVHVDQLQRVSAESGLLLS